MTMMLMNNKCWWWWQYDDEKVGSSLTLPCNTTNLGDLVLLWRQARKHNFHYIHDYWKASSSLWSSKRIIFGPILQLYISSLNFLVHSSFVNFLLQLFISHFNFHPPIFQFILHLVISHPTPVLHFISYFHFIFPCLQLSISSLSIPGKPDHLCWRHQGEEKSLFSQLSSSSSSSSSSSYYVKITLIKRCVGTNGSASMATIWGLRGSDPKTTENTLVR